MSEQNDNLKSMFDQAFDAEQIPFDQNAWSQMEALLNKRERRRAIWLWFAGLVIFTSAASWYGLDAQSSAFYSPRSIAGTNSSKAEVIEHTFDSSAPNDVSEKALQSATVDKEVSNTSEFVHIDSKQVANDLDRSSLIREKSISPTSEAVYVENGAEELEEVESAIIVSEPKDSSLYNAPNNGKERLVQPAMTKTLLLPLMPILDITNKHAYDPIDQNAQPNRVLIKRAKYVYARAGISKSLMYSGVLANGIGQFGAIGGQVQLRSHLLISGEIGFSRSRVFDQVSIAGPKTYGYSVGENTAEIVTDEMLDLEIPMFIQYRFNRLVVGTGISPIILLGIRNRTDQVVSNESSSVNYSSLDGYYQWNRYRRLNVNALLDAQYQLSADAFVGTRANLGLLNRAADDLSDADFARFELYLKINLK